MAEKKEAWTLRRAIEVVVAALMVASAVGTLGVGVAFSAGAWKAANAMDDTQNVVRVMSGVLGAFAITLTAEFLLSRTRDDAMLSQIRSLDSKTETALASLHPVVDGVLKRRDELPSLNTSLQNAASLKMSGLSLRTFTHEQLGSVRKMISRGGHCRFLLLEPHSPASGITAKNFLGMEDPRPYDSEVSESLKRLQGLQAAFPGKVELRTLNHIPAASITIVEDMDRQALAVIEFYTEEESSLGRPHLSLTPEESPLWFQYFHGQFDILWSHGTEVN